MLSIGSESFPDVDSFGLSAGYLWRLLDYPGHRRFRAALRSVVHSDTASWITAEWQKKVKLCRRNHDDHDACWFVSYLAFLRRTTWLSSGDAKIESANADSLTNAWLCLRCGHGRSIATRFGFVTYVEDTLRARESEECVARFCLSSDYRS
ncbi:hypothetical protein NUW54_g6054 [Trametes sanguinea]|uniref:Uncharacterized protein n=1 Tax=Trametes sanguinea TaxID=158606 RepID=A0ACC1PTE6_9APHY|nr:hypothetical protein NUW54_g6054 [Trametes sanguinea]